MTHETSTNSIDKKIYRIQMIKCSSTYMKNTILVTLWNGFLAEERKQSVAPCILAQKTTSQQPNWSLCVEELVLSHYKGRPML